MSDKNDESELIVVFYSFMDELLPHLWMFYDFPNVIECHIVYDIVVDIILLLFFARSGW